MLAGFPLLQHARLDHRHLRGVRGAHLASRWCPRCSGCSATGSTRCASRSSAAPYAAGTSRRAAGPRLGDWVAGRPWRVLIVTTRRARRARRAAARRSSSARSTTGTRGEGTTARRAYELMSAGFGPGANGPLDRGRRSSTRPGRGRGHRRPPMTRRSATTVKYRLRMRTRRRRRGARHRPAGSAGTGRRADPGAPRLRAERRARDRRGRARPRARRAGRERARRRQGGRASPTRATASPTAPRWSSAWSCCSARCCCCWPSARRWSRSRPR